MDERVIDRQCMAIADLLLTCAPAGSRPHHLLVGPPGIGKSTALDAIVDKVAAVADPDELLIVKTAPNGYGISSYREFLAEIAWAIGYGALERGGTVRELEDRIQDAAADRAVLFVIDNLDHVFDKIGGTTQFGGGGGQGAFRGWIETWGQAMILGSAGTVSHWFGRREYPWFGSFDIIAVEPFTCAQAHQYLRKIAADKGDSTLVHALNSQAGRGSVDALYGYFGGIPRHWSLLSRAVTAPTLLTNTQACVAAVCDQMVPYHRIVLAKLAPGQRRIVHELALADEPLTVAELAQRVGVSNQNAAATLGRLSAAGITQAHKRHNEDQRRTWYALGDALLHAQVRYLNGYEPERKLVS